jgi:hypothetical protein
MKIPRPRAEHKLSLVLSRKEVWRILDQVVWSDASRLQPIYRQSIGDKTTFFFGVFYNNTEAQLPGCLASV